MHDSDEPEVAGHSKMRVAIGPIFLAPTFLFLKIENHARVQIASVAGALLNENESVSPSSPESQIGGRILENQIFSPVTL